MKKFRLFCGCSYIVASSYLNRIHTYWCTFSEGFESTNPSSVSRTVMQEILAYRSSSHSRWKYQAVSGVLRDQLPRKSCHPQVTLTGGHVVPWIQRWGVGLGYHGEQGAESIHRVFNSLKRTYASVRSPTDRLEHPEGVLYLQTAPRNVAVTPTVKRQKRGEW